MGRPTDEEIERVRNTPADTPEEVRGKLVCCLLVDGIHREELLTMALPDLRLGMATIRVPGGVAPISKYTVKAILDYLEIRVSRSDNMTLFTDFRDGSMVVWHQTLDERGRGIWGFKTVGRPITCNEYLSYHLYQIQSAHPLMTIAEIARISRINYQKAEWLLGKGIATNHY